MFIPIIIFSSSLCIVKCDITSNNSMLPNAFEAFQPYLPLEWYAMPTSHDSNATAAGPYGIMNLAHYVATKAMEKKEVGKRDTPIDAPTRLPLNKNNPVPSSDYGGSSSDRRVEQGRYEATSREVDLEKFSSVKDRTHESTRDFVGDRSQGFSSPESRDQSNRNYPTYDRRDDSLLQSGGRDPMRDAKPWQDDPRRSNEREPSNDGRSFQDDSRRHNDSRERHNRPRQDDSVRSHYGGTNHDDNRRWQDDTRRENFGRTRDGNKEVTSQYEYHSRQSTKTDEKSGKDREMDIDRHKPHMDKKEPRKGRYIHRIVIRNKNICPPPCCCPPCQPQYCPRPSSTSAGVPRGSNPYYFGYK